MIWIFMFILLLPFFMAFYLIKNVGLVDTYNGLQKAQNNIDIYSRVLKICKHIAEKTTLALEDLKYIDKRKYVVYACNDKRAIDFVINGALELTCKIQEIEKKCSDIVNINLKDKNQFNKVIDKFYDKSDIEIIKYFIPEEDMEYFQDLDFTKKYIEYSINEKRKANEIK